jgi:hypothetical protein
MAKIFLFSSLKKLIFNFVKFVATKKGLTTNFFCTPLFCCCFWIRDQEWVKIRIRDPEWVKIMILDKHSGSATLFVTLYSNMDYLKKKIKLRPDSWWAGQHPTLADHQPGQFKGNL